MKYSISFVTVSILHVTALMLANTVSAKLVALGPFVVAGGIVIFPLTYIFGDILTEVYGYRQSRRIIWLGFLAQIVMVTGYLTVQALPAAPFWDQQAAFAAILGVVPRLVLASMIAYLCGEFTNSVALSRMKVLMKGKRLWARTIGSTVVGEGIDSAIFACIAFAGVLPWPAIIQVALSGYILKVAYEVLATPLTYAIVGYLKRAEGVDTYDVGVNYNPFVITERAS